MIPPITDPMGRHWDQPPREDILVDDEHAVMTASTFTALLEYSSSIPSGVYDGKMWRRHDYGDCLDLLMWFGPSDDPGKCKVNSRIILLV